MGEARRRKLAGDTTPRTEKKPKFKGARLRSENQMLAMASMPDMKSLYRRGVKMLCRR